jgi:N-acetylneuraminic acid mutarotase
MKSRLVQWFGIGLVASVALPAVAQSSGTFATTGSMTTGRFAGLATLLPNGQVLVAGGTDGGTAVATAELYSPSTGTWATTGSMTTARDGNSMTLLQTGQVLVVGGKNAKGTYLASAELYNPSTGTWTATGSMSTLHVGGPATLLPNGQVLVAGGVNASDTILRTAELYNPATATWARTGNMTTPRTDARAVLLETGKVLVAGGINSSSLFSAELYDPATGKWTATGSIPNTAGDGLTATVLQSGKVLVFEGASSTASLYDPASGQWSAISFTAGRRNDAVATLLGNGKVMFTGGLVYVPRPTHTVASATLYDPLTGAAEGNGSLLISRYGHSATLLPNGQVLIAGGEEINSPGSALLSESELYTP